jgi:hypothetical protein
MNFDVEDNGNVGRGPLRPDSPMSCEKAQTRLVRGGGWDVSRASIHLRVNLNVAPPSDMRTTAALGRIRRFYMRKI